MAASEPNHFLVQVNDRGSTNVLQNSKYSNNDWQSRGGDKAHGDVKSGDLLLFYFAGQAIDYQKQLRLVFRVSNVSDDHKEFSLERYQELNPLGLSQLRNLVKAKQLGESFLNCGRQGFNICQLDKADFEKAIRLAGEGGFSLPVVGAEDLLEDFLVNNWNPGRYFGSELSNLELLKDRDGTVIGQQYDTKEAGIIDLLCKDRRSGGYVVIEIKRTSESDEVVGQIARYMGWVKSNLANGKDVMGIILCPDYDKRLQYAASVIPNCLIAKYRVDFSIALQT